MLSSSMCREFPRKRMSSLGALQCLFGERERKIVQIMFKLWIYASQISHLDWFIQSVSNQKSFIFTQIERQRDCDLFVRWNFFTKNSSFQNSNRISSKRTKTRIYVPPIIIYNFTFNVHQLIAGSFKKRLKSNKFIEAAKPMICCSSSICLVTR